MRLARRRARRRPRCRSRDRCGGRAPRRDRRRRGAPWCWPAAPLRATPTSSRPPATGTGVASIVWFGDDRCVPATIRSPISCSCATRCSSGSSSTRPCTRSRPTCRRPRPPLRYDAELRGEPLDLVLLGLGPDGHTASLFPGRAPLDERERLVVATEPGLEPFVERVTLTIPALESGAHVVFLVVGEGKGRRRPACVRGSRRQPDAGEPRALARRPDDRDPRRCCRLAPVLTRCD